MKRVISDREPFVDPSKFQPGWGWNQWGCWPAAWVDHPDRSLTDPSVAVFRLKFTLPSATPLRLHVSADNRYRIFLDGADFGRGPERGDMMHWFFETYEGMVAEGEHTLSVMTWWLGEDAPFAQMSVRPGFLLAAEGDLRERLTTGCAKWQAALVPGIEFIPAGPAWGVGANVRIDGTSYPWGWERGTDPLEWRDAVKIADAVSAQWKNEALYWRLLPSMLPPMRDERMEPGALRYLAAGKRPYPVSEAAHLAGEARSWREWLSGDAPVEVPAQSTRTAVIDLENYYCAYPELVLSGGKGASVRLDWAEGLFTQADGGSKGQRDEINGKFFCGGVCDEFIPDGGDQRLFTTLWWKCGRYLELTVTTGDTPLTLNRLSVRCTGYPLKMEGQFASSEIKFSRFLPIAERAMQMCAHETYMDCPYYEQLMYVGDTRLEVLTTYAMTADDRLPRKALLMFDWSRRNSGMTQSRYPSRWGQMIPPFSLWWVCMVHDFWMWRDDQAFVEARMPGVRAVMEYFRTLMRPDGIMAAPNGWNFTDWVQQPVVWGAGTPPGAEFEPSSILNLQCALALLRKAELEDGLGETQLAERDRATARRLTDAVMKVFWCEAKGMIADDAKHACFSEHAQCLALLGGWLNEGQRRLVGDALGAAPSLARATIYFTHYLFEVYRILGRSDLFFERLKLWYELDEKGFKTTFEAPEPSRSDCHAWGAHPLFHSYATILGIRPDAPGFSRVRIAPMPGALQRVSGTYPHPRGQVRVELEQGNGVALEARVCLPAGLEGVFVWRGEERMLSSGETVLKW